MFYYLFISIKVVQISAFWFHLFRSKYQVGMGMDKWMKNEFFKWPHEDNNGCLFFAQKNNLILVSSSFLLDASKAGHSTQEFVSAIPEKRVTEKTMTYVQKYNPSYLKYVFYMEKKVHPSRVSFVMRLLPNHAMKSFLLMKHFESKCETLKNTAM